LRESETPGSERGARERDSDEKKESDKSRYIYIYVQNLVLYCNIQSQIQCLKIHSLLVDKKKQRKIEKDYFEA